jgi:SAM-dependent methyltransferase
VVALTEQLRCPVCCGSQFVLVHRDVAELRFDLAERFSLERCVSCGTIVTTPRPDARYLNRLYEEIYLPPEYQAPNPALIHASMDTSRRISAHVRRQWRSERSTEIPALFFDGPTARHFPANGSVLDIGAYTGENMLWLAAAGYTVVGLEPSARAAAVGQRLGLDIRDAPIEQPDLPSALFDVAYMSYVIEHLMEPGLALANVRRLLKPGGRLLVTTHNVHSVWRYVFRDYWFHWHTPFHLFHTHPRSLCRLVEGAGFASEFVGTQTPTRWLLYSIRALRNRLLSRRQTAGLYEPLAPITAHMLNCLLTLEKAGAQGDCTSAVFRSI